MTPISGHGYASVWTPPRRSYRREFLGEGIVSDLPFCPPALVPLLTNGGDGHGYVGLWVPWFHGRELTYAYWRDDDAGWAEVGLNFDQLLVNLVSIDGTSDFEPRDTEELRLFWGAATDELVAELNQSIEKRGSVYPGSRLFSRWPYGAWMDLAEDRHQVPPWQPGGYTLGLETGDTIHDRWGDLQIPFLDLRVRFDRALAAGDHAAAWQALNTDGWKSVEMGEAFQRFAQAMGSPFTELYAGWSATCTLEF
jgi:hypothetical protein